MKQQYPALRLHKVWNEKDEVLINEIIDVWRNAKVLPPNSDPHERAKQVVLVVRNENEKIIGITTALRRPFPQLRNDLYYVRGLILPDFRLPGLFAKMSLETFKTLEDHTIQSTEQKKPIGTISEIENKRLKEANLTRLPSGMTLLGFSQNNNPIYVHYFKGAQF